MFSPPHCRASQLPHQSKLKLSQRYTFSSRLSAWVGVSSSVYALIASILIRVISLENGADNIHPLFNSGSKENYPAQHLSGTNQHQPWHWMIFAVTENGQSHLLLLVFLCGETSQPVSVHKLLASFLHLQTLRLVLFLSCLKHWLNSENPYRELMHGKLTDIISLSSPWGKVRQLDQCCYSRRLWKAGIEKVRWW